MLDAYNYFLKHPGYNKLVGDNYLFVEYKCPFQKDHLRLWTPANFITYALSGRKDWIDHKKVYTLKKGEALFIKKGVYGTKQYFDVDYCVLLFFINDTFIHDFMEENKSLIATHDLSGSQESIFPIDVNDSLRSLLNTVFTYFKKEQIPRQLVEIKFRELMYNLVLNPNHKELVQFFSSCYSQSSNDISSIMNKHFRDALSSADLAKLCGMSLSTFKREFSKIYKTTPGKWITEKRLEYAKSLLRDQELTINEVCYDSGFKNPSHFNKIFKEYFQLPPNQYRKSLV